MDGWGGGGGGRVCVSLVTFYASFPPYYVALPMYRQRSESKVEF